MPVEGHERPPLRALLALLDDGALQRDIERLPGYSARETGDTRCVAV
jgi:hypothetical protein